MPTLDIEDRTANFWAAQSGENERPISVLTATLEIAGMKADRFASWWLVLPSERAGMHPELREK